MRIPFRNFNNKKSRIFLDYFNAMLRQKQNSFPTGSAGYNIKDQFICTIGDTIKFKNNTIPIEWKITQDSLGNILFIDANPIEKSIKEKGWELNIHKFIEDVLQAALTEKVDKFYMRKYFCYEGPNLDGEYWINNIRFAPVIQNDESINVVNFERYCCVDQIITAIDSYHADILAETTALRFINRISLILDVGFYQPKSAIRWVIITRNNGKSISERHSLGFIEKDKPSEMPKKGSLCKLGEYKGSVLDDFQTSSIINCPIETRKIMSRLCNIEMNLRESFDACARMYRVGLTAGRYFSTIQLAYLVSSVEAASNRAKLGLSFTDFVKKYNPEAIKIEDFLDYIYSSVRSAHLHGGAFPLDNEFKNITDITNQKSLESFSILYQAKILIRKAIINWIIKNIVSYD